jgi:hypothetical protein
MTSSAPKSFEEFWPFYVSQHTRAATRYWHFGGTTLALVCLLGVALGWSRLLLAGALFVGYGGAWIGHFLVERNRPATFGHPLWSLRGDMRMYRLTLGGRMAAEVERLRGADVPPVAEPLPSSRGVAR